MSQECCICKKVKASTEYAVKLQKSDEKIFVNIPVCNECKSDFKLLSQLLTMFAVFITMVVSTIMLFMAWGYQHTNENFTAILFALTPILIGYLAYTWNKNMMRKSHFRRMSLEYPDVAEKVKEGYE